MTGVLLGRHANVDWGWLQSLVQSNVAVST